MFCIDTISFSNISSASVAESMHVEPVGTEGVTGRSHEGLPWERWKVICPAVNHRSAFRCAQHTPACSGAAAGFIYLFWGTDPFRALGWGSGSAGGCLVSRACSELHTGPCSLSREALLWGWGSLWRGGGTPEVSGSSPPIGQFSKSAFKFSFSFPKERGRARGAFSTQILFLVCRYQQAAPHWACSDVSDVADKQQPAGTRLKIVVLPPPRAASGICQTDDKVPWTESHQTAFGAECTAKLS
ncbi:PREDICTED: uncharacterized protein LOC106149467 isoform X1 [Chinchilla lanigera]|uniref:uncharacterized protein LOC106149467 isoform X1 n=1 Tax=Chinchilla lanigera TaxID=34839 RepID=UPI0006966B43|nr:PREDICTED: uncharacterized protein LOC106149467 isoform X1 [Chinchilla lanigera]